MKASHCLWIPWFFLKDLMLIPQVHILNNTDYAITQCELQTSQFEKLVKGFHNMELCAQRTHNTLSLNTTTYRVQRFIHRLQCIWCQRNEKWFEDTVRTQKQGSLPRLFSQRAQPLQCERSQQVRKSLAHTTHLLKWGLGKRINTCLHAKVAYPLAKQWALFK